MTRVIANGIDQEVHLWGPVDGTPVLLIHGNCSSGPFWAPLVRALPTHWRIAAPDLRGYGATQTAPVDATRGLGDLADDVAALIDPLFGPDARVVVAGHSMGGGVAMRLLVDHPDRVAGVLLESPLSPYGFGGTTDIDGTPYAEDFAGTGGGAGNPDFVRRIAERDRGSDAPTSPRTVMRTTYVADPDAFGADEEAMLDTLLDTATGLANYPGDSTPSTGWPGFAPGPHGVLNAMSGRYFTVAAALVAVAPKPPIVWVHGDRDVIVSDASMMDLAHLGQLGIIPGSPGYPAQPMVTQTRSVLERYAGAGGWIREVLYAGVGHSPHIERTAEFAAELIALVGG